MIKSALKKDPNTGNRIDNVQNFQEESFVCDLKVYLCYPAFGRKEVMGK